MSKIVVSRQELTAALLFASTDENRYVLNGLLIETNGRTNPTIVSTDGRRLAVIQTKADQPEDGRDEHTLLLRADFVKPLAALSKAIGGKLFPWIEFNNNAGSKRVHVTFVGSHFHAEIEEGVLIEGQYPNWRAILPAKKAQRMPINDLGLNAEMIGDFAKAAKIMESETPIVQMNLIGKEQAIEVRLPSLPEFYGIIMPCKVDESVDYQPEFLQVSKMFPAPPTSSDDDSQPEEKAHVTSGEPTA